MRKPRDFDTELRTLEEKARQLKERKIRQLGELVIATGADALTIDELAGALVAIADMKEVARKEGWARRGAAFFAGRSGASDRRLASPDTGHTTRSASSAAADIGGARPPDDSPPSTSGSTGTL